jgi:hypothetical protein
MEPPAPGLIHGVRKPVTAGQFVELIERMITADRKLTREQLDELHRQRQQPLPDDFTEAGAG